MSLLTRPSGPAPPPSAPRTVSPSRVALVGGALFVVGGVLGAAAGGGAVALGALLDGRWGTISAIALAVAVPVGAWLGSMLAPVTALLLLRRVPLWQALVWPTLGTAVGGGVAWHAGSPVATLLWALAGYAAAVLALAVRGRARGARAAAAPTKTSSPAAPPRAPDRARTPCTD